MNLEAGNAGALSFLSMKHFQTRIKNKKSEVPLIDHQWDFFLFCIQSRDKLMIVNMWLSVSPQWPVSHLSTYDNLSFVE